MSAVYLYYRLWVLCVGPPWRINYSWLLTQLSLSARIVVVHTYARVYMVCVCFQESECGYMYVFWMLLHILGILNAIWRPHRTMHLYFIATLMDSASWIQDGPSNSQTKGMMAAPWHHITAWYSRINSCTWSLTKVYSRKNSCWFGHSKSLFEPLNQQWDLLSQPRWHVQASSQEDLDSLRYSEKTSKKITSCSQWENLHMQSLHIHAYVLDEVCCLDKPCFKMCVHALLYVYSVLYCTTCICANFYTRSYMFTTVALLQQTSSSSLGTFERSFASP